MDNHNMEQPESARHYKRIALTVFLLLGGILLIIYYYREAQNLAFKESSVNLTEVSRQISDAIKRQSEDRWKALDMIGRYLNDTPGQDAEEFLSRAREQWGFDSLCLVDEDSVYYDREMNFSLLTQSDIADRLLTRREAVILDDVLYGDQRQLIFLLPVEDLTIRGKEFRAIGLRYGSDNIFNILSISAYGDQSDLYIVHKDGTTLYRSVRGKGVDGYNLFNSLENCRFFRGSVQELRQADTGITRLMTVSVENTVYYINHMPIAVGDWELVMMVPTDVVSRSMSRFSLLSGVCLGTAAALFLIVVVLFYTDFIGRSLRAEEKARKAAESANLSKSRFLSSMSHDIRTPMNAVVGMAHIAEENLGDPEKVRECLRQITLSGRLLVGLINDILDMSRIESGNMALNNDTVSLSQVLDTIVNIAQPMVKEKRLNFNVRVKNVEHERLCFDSLRLNQVLLNLLSNALKFTPEKGSISVDVTEEGLTQEGKARFVFQVADTGIGMQPEFVAQIFTAYLREKDSRVERIEGTGLGMAITKSIVDLMGGTIEIESAPGKGSCFTVRLDLDPDETTQEELPSLPPVRLLIVDDDPLTCETAFRYLAELGMEGDTACGGKEALEMVKEAGENGRDYRIVILDWKMPDMDGITVTRELRAKLGDRVSIFVISAYDWSEIEGDARKAGVDGFIRKPFFKSTLYRLLSRYLSGEERPEKEEESVKPDLTKRHILLAEDNEINREIAVEILTGLGAEVTEACNGAEGLKCFMDSGAGYYDLILMDIQMPVMDGYEAAERIRRLERTDAADIPIIAMTADAFAEDITKAKAVGMTAHLAKPLDIPTMMRLLSRYLT